MIQPARGRRTAALIHLYQARVASRAWGQDADEHAARLRRELGPQLDAHDDERGILFFSDVCEVSAKTYAAVVREIGSAGKWGLASKVTSKRAPRVDRLLRESAHERGLGHEWFVERSRKKASRDEPSGARRLRARSRQRAGRRLRKECGRKRRARPGRIEDRGIGDRRVVPRESRYDPDVAEMVRLFGGDEKSWSALLDPKREPSVGDATRLKTKR